MHRQSGELATLCTQNDLIFVDMSGTPNSRAQLRTHTWDMQHAAGLDWQCWPFRAAGRKADALKRSQPQLDTPTAAG
jgi:hypothetical protein